MREIVIDTETTGLSSRDGHRVVEIGCVELRAGGPTGRVWHSYFNPERSVPQAAVAIHGLTEAFLNKAPLFKERAAEFLAFIGIDGLVGHNASFDLAFLNAELSRCGQPALSNAVDTLDLARRKLPGRHHTLDALCDHFGVSRAAREKHGALLDAQLLAEVYGHLTGRAAMQFALDLFPASTRVDGTEGALQRPSPLPARFSEAERAAHTRFIRGFGAPPLWDRHERTEKNETSSKAQKR